MERRNFPRVPLDAPVFIEIQPEGMNRLPSMLVDIGKGGIQAAVSPELTNTNELLGAQVLIFGLPVPPAPGDEGIPGRVTWAGANRCGVRFAQPLEVPEASIAEFAASL